MTPVPEEQPKKRCASDFVFGKLIGEGSFSSVYLAKDVHTSKEFAVKILRKVHIKRERKMEYVMREKNVLLRLSSCSMFVRLFCTFQDNEYLYFVLTYAKNGDLLQYINEKLSLDSVRYYTAEIVLALEVLNSKQIVHRDLKPENILLDENWHTLITDFGSAKLLDEEENEDANRRRKNSFVGTAQYVTPEVLNNKEVSAASDLWALGCIIFQMVSCSSPFNAGSEYLIFKKILDLKYEFPEDFDPDAKNLIEQLLVIESSDRLGAKDTAPYTSLRKHQFFSGLNFEDLGPPPKLADSSREYEFGEELVPGFDNEKASRLHLELICPPSPPKKRNESKYTPDLEESEIDDRLNVQKNDKWHQFVEGNLILKQGLIDKKKGLFARRRMLLLTRGPHLYYIDPGAMILKGEIPWSCDLRTEAKNFKNFLVHTPKRIYYLEDPDGFALEWCKAIDEVKSHYYPAEATASSSTDATPSASLAATSSDTNTTPVT